DTSILTNYIIATNLPPTLSLGPASLDFGPVIIGQTNTRSFQLTNLGDLTLTGTVMTTPPFVIQSEGSFSLTNGQTAQVLVGFAPGNAANFSNVVIFTSNGGNSTNPVIGSGLTPAQPAVWRHCKSSSLILPRAQSPMFPGTLATARPAIPPPPRCRTSIPPPEPTR